MNSIKRIGIIWVMYSTNLTIRRDSIPISNRWDNIKNSCRRNSIDIISNSKRMNSYTIRNHRKYIKNLIIRNRLKNHNIYNLVKI